MQPAGDSQSIREHSPYRWTLLAFLTTGMFFCYAQRGTLSVAAPYMMQDLGLTKASMGVLLSAFFWSYSLAQVPAGWIIDRFGVGRVYAIGFLIWTLAVALTGIPSTIAMLIVLRMLLGIGQSVAFPASSRASASWFPPGERGGVTGVYLAGNRLGQAAIGAVGPAVIAAFGWRPFFVIAGLTGFVWLAAWLLHIRWWDTTDISARDSGTARISRAEALRILHDRRMAGIFLGFFAYDYVWYLFLTWMPSYLMLDRKFGPREMTIANSIPFLVVSFVIVLAGVAGDSLVRAGWNEVTARKSIITAGLLIACLIVPAGFVQSSAVSAWLLGIAICGLGLAAPNSWALTQAVCPKSLVATASGVQNFGGNLGGVVAPALTGLIAHQTGNFRLAFLIAGGVLMFGIACYWLLIPKSYSGEGDSIAEPRGRAS